jgi:hypothetical protein
MVLRGFKSVATTARARPFSLLTPSLPLPPPHPSLPHGPPLMKVLLKKVFFLSVLPPLLLLLLLLLLPL